MTAPARPASRVVADDAGGRVVRGTLAALGLLLALGCAAAESPATPDATADAFVIRLLDVPDETPEGAAIHLAGSFNGWNPAAAGYQLERDAGGVWSIELPEDVRGAIEFKFTLGSWERVEANGTGGDVHNRTAQVSDGGGVYEGTVAGWRQAGSGGGREETRTASVSILSEAFHMPQLGRSRRVWLYLPPGYETSGRRYPVLYMHDAQNVFDDATSFVGEWGVDETLDSLVAAGDPGVIAVAVDHGEDLRIDEYSPWVNERHGGGEGEQYVDFLVQTLKPFIDAGYRTLPDRLNTGIAGSSMGGLISLYALLRYPDVFGRAGVFSPAFWFAPQVFEMAAAAAQPLPDTRIWMVSGALETQTGEESYEHGQAVMVDTLADAGYRTGVEVKAYVSPDGTHSEWFWRREFPAAYRWLFGESQQGSQETGEVQDR